MINDWWDRPVRVMLGPNTAYNVASSVKAAEILLNEWPAAGSKSHRAARKAVLHAMEHADDRRARQAARRAFETAARDADILVER